MLLFLMNNLEGKWVACFAGPSLWLEIVNGSASQVKRYHSLF